ncbi:hypothetical protein SPRG_01784 [Saprolegnia parasitica CBS 223.65]|uniref:UBC core domain-containing protein n=1 Tax=Saprolegnia parasitica (strain CBS 223.65) TaxID=695850 RepID=A0A067CT66_SAPPC|nr:hypothetical protein SPRG_01784 [Saprolegnia parasitica CBS 223.65]KDO33904.1 hypothetical protein SPRG_01784 [Saprolegnia parasitica CBS 223.65]|eukprot:XP_012195540.1 hypothetical protein SPRG_01784 [Saprolegnia parasitica CBS 223.65]
MSNAANLPRRIVKETQRLLAEPVPGISATPYEDNLRYFQVVIAGPQSSPYENGIFKLELFLPADYPMAPPKVRFLTRIYHPNIDKLGRICLDILKDKWSPALQIRTVLLSIQALLSAPTPMIRLRMTLPTTGRRTNPVLCARPWSGRAGSRKRSFPSSVPFPRFPSTISALSA